MVPIPGLDNRRATSPTMSTTMPVTTPSAILPASCGTNGHGYKWIEPYELADRVRKWGVSFTLRIRTNLRQYIYISIAAYAEL